LPAILIHHANFARPYSIVHSIPVCLPKTPLRDKPTSEERAGRLSDARAGAGAHLPTLPLPSISPEVGMGYKV